MNLQPTILLEDNHLLVVNKPSGWVTQGASAGQPSLVAWARHYLKHKYHKPGNVYVGVVSRIDAPVSGVVVLARTSKAAERLNRQFQRRTVGKTYLAVVEGAPPAAGEAHDWLLHDDDARRVRVVGSTTAGAAEARLKYRVRSRGGGLAVLEIALETGRKHQIRVQLASRGWPIVGDRKYGSRRPFREGLALHAWQLRFEHPTRHTEVEITAPPPSNWHPLGVNLPDTATSG